MPASLGGRAAARGGARRRRQGSPSMQTARAGGKPPHMRAIHHARHTEARRAALRASSEGGARLCGAALTALIAAVAAATLSRSIVCTSASRGAAGPGARPARPPARSASSWYSAWCGCSVAMRTSRSASTACEEPPVSCSRLRGAGKGKGEEWLPVLRTGRASARSSCSTAHATQPPGRPEQAGSCLQVPPGASSPEHDYSIFQ